MEGLNDRPWRRAYSQVIGGMDEMCTEFIRMPNTGHAKSLSKAYDDEGIHVPLAAQIMGEHPEPCLEIALEIEKRGAPRIDLNCGCPSSTVVGNGAGSSLLKTPDHIYRILSLLTARCKTPISVKMRAGYTDISLFEDNLKAAEAAGVCMITLHPRTRVQGYSGQADWSLIAKAKQTVQTPIVGSGDVNSFQDALKLHQMSGCDGIMIGRGAFNNPWIFWQIRAGFASQPHLQSPQEEVRQLQDLGLLFLKEIEDLSPRGKAGRIKQWLRFLSQGNPLLGLPLKNLLVQNLPAELLVDQLCQFWSQNEQQPLSSR
jgi:tRNA-dihydrouridine synthase C